MSKLLPRIKFVRIEIPTPLHARIKAMAAMEQTTIPKRIERVVCAEAEKIKIP